jgi:hypothetical protein
MESTRIGHRTTALAPVLPRRLRVLVTPHPESRRSLVSQHPAAFGRDRGLSLVTDSGRQHQQPAEPDMRRRSTSARRAQSGSGVEPRPRVVAVGFAVFGYPDLDLS